MLRTVLIVAAIAAFAAPVEAGAPAPPQSAIEKLVRAKLVLKGKVTSVAPDTVLAASTLGGTEKVEFKVATIKIESGIVGAENTTHVRVGFLPQPKLDPNATPALRRRFQTIELKEGQQMLLYLVKHPTADFYIMPGMSPPVDATSDKGMKELEALKRYTKVIAEPMKGLKSDKSEVRAETAASLVMKYRAYPDFGGEMAVAEVAIPADENKLILEALAEADWVRLQGPNGRNLYQPTPMQAFLQLYLSEKDGWIPPMMKPGDNYYGIHKAAFVRWRTGPGKDYVIKKFVPTTKPKK